MSADMDAAETGAGKRRAGKGPGKGGAGKGRGKGQVGGQGVGQGAGRGAGGKGRKAQPAAPAKPRTLPEAIQAARQAAQAWTALTGRPLGAAEAVAMGEASRLLGLTLADPEAEGFEAQDPAGRRLRLRARGAGGELTGPIRLGPPDKEGWDDLTVVFLDPRLRVREILQLDRAAAFAASGGKPRLPLKALREAARVVWTRGAPKT